jgi:hypothetical protein
MPKTKKTNNKQIVKAVDSDGKRVEVAVLRPTAKVSREAQKIYNRFFRDALESGALLRQKLDGYMTEQGLWSDVKQTEYDKLTKAIIADEKTINAGGIKLSEAKALALSMADKRLELRDLIAERTIMDGNTAEGQADNGRFNYLMASCIVDQTSGSPVFADEDGNPSVDVYDENAGEDYVVKCAGKLAEMMYGLDSSYEANLPENKFLKKFDFINDDLHLVNDDGHTVDREGRLVNEDGRFIDKDGNFVDKEGTPINEEGEYIIETKPFLDDDGNELIIEDKEEPKKTKKTKQTKEEASASQT